MKLRKCLSKIIAFSMGLCMIAGSGTVYADSEMNLSAEANNEGNYVSLKWNAPDSSNRYSYMIYSKESNESEFQSIPAKASVRVLNVYPNVGNNLKKWMENPNSESSNGYGKGLISVDEVTIDSFNGNPDIYMKDSEGNWKYDVVYFGGWDSNNKKDISSSAKNSVEEFIKAGRGVLFGHDTLYKTLFSNFWSLAGYVNMTSPVPVNNQYGTSSVKITRKGLLTNYPWSIGDVGTTLSVPLSHSTAQYAYGDIWMKYTGNTWTSISEVNEYEGKECTNNFYLTTWNN